MIPKSLGFDESEEVDSNANNAMIVEEMTTSLDT